MYYIHLTIYCFFLVGHTHTNHQLIILQESYHQANLVDLLQNPSLILNKVLLIIVKEFLQLSPIDLHFEVGHLVLRHQIQS